MRLRQALSRAEPFLAALLPAALFLALGSIDLGLPALSQAETVDPYFGLLVSHGVMKRIVAWSLPLGGRLWPLHIPHAYDFCIFDVYWSALAFAAAGASVAVLRLSALLLGAATIVAFYALCRLWLGRSAALAAGLLLAVSPPFLLWGRLAYWAVEAQLALPATLALTLVSVWHLKRRPWALNAGAFVWGLSTCVSTKAVAFLLAYPALYLALVPRKRWPSPGQAAVATACALLGAADFIGFNLAYGFPIPAALLAALRAPTQGGVDNHALAANLATRWQQLRQTLDGGYATVTAGRVAARDVLFPVAFFASYASLAWRCLRGRPFRGRGLVLLLLWLIPALLLETCFTPNALDPQHLLVLWPFTVGVVAAALGWGAEVLDARRPRAGATAAAAAAALLLVSGLRVDAGYFARAGRDRGNVWSEGLGELAEYLDAPGRRRPLLVGAPISSALAVATGGRVFGIQADSVNGEDRWAARPGFTMVFGAFHKHAVEDDDALALSTLRARARASGGRLIEVASFPLGSPNPHYTVWRREEAARGRRVPR